MHPHALYAYSHTPPLPFLAYFSTGLLCSVEVGARAAWGCGVYGRGCFRIYRDHSFNSRNCHTAREPSRSLKRKCSSCEPIPSAEPSKWSWRKRSMARAASTIQERGDGARRRVGLSRERGLPRWVVACIVLRVCIVYDGRLIWWWRRRVEVPINELAANLAPSLFTGRPRFIARFITWKPLRADDFCLPGTDTCAQHFSASYFLRRTNKSVNRSQDGSANYREKKTRMLPMQILGVLLLNALFAIPFLNHSNGHICARFLLMFFIVVLQH